MIYQNAGKADIEQLVLMRLNYIKCDHGSISEENERAMRTSLPEYFNKNLGKNLFAFVAKDNDVIVSTALLLIIEKPSNPHFINGKIGEVLNVYTKDEYRNCGIATKLMRNLIAFAKENMLDYVELSATKDGYPIYKKTGFEETNSSDIQMKYDL